MYKQIFWITEYGAAPAVNNNASAIQQAIQACHDAGGGTVCVPPGIFTTGPLFLLGNVALHLEAGATLLGSPLVQDYPLEAVPLSMESNFSGLITALDAENITIEGRGSIDGNALAFMRVGELHTGGHTDYDRRYVRQGEEYGHPRFGVEHGPWAHGDRPGNMLRFYRCKNVLIRDVTICNSPTWTVHFNHCEGINILGAHIHSRASQCRVPNDDGIDLEFCRQVHISDCDIETGDDCIALFGSQRVTVSNCTLSSRSAGIRVGYHQGFTADCAFNNLTIHSNRGITINVRAENSVENLLFSNLIIHTQLFTGHWWGKGEPIHISAVPMYPDGKLGSIRNIRFQNLLIEGQSGILIYGSQNARIQNITFSSVRFHLAKGPLQESYGGNFDLRTHADLSRALFAHDIYALYARCVDGLALHEVDFTYDEDLPPFYLRGLCLEDVEGLAGFG